MTREPGDGMAVYVFNLGPVWATRQIIAPVTEAVRVAGWRGLLPRLHVVAWCIARVWWTSVSYHARLAARRVAAAFALVALTGCSNLGPAKLASNALDDALVAAAPDIEAQCIEPFAPERVTATDLAERMRQADELRRRRELSGCRPILRTYDDARNAQLLLRASVGAVELGECVGVSRSVERCNVAAAMAAAWRAREAVIAAGRRLRGER